ncbi:DUF309 domain-containing protein [Effusibacillus pohliae]|uniref:DUF309 domain-containing protein n=1 Tax=Effusibacillus pohliae TaxID=232270 RepID=UPI00037661BA|nr:DUF309 domain-containing protein [Effusibacillus pohliae]
MNEITRRFVVLFNEEEDFYECHEIFEWAWKQTDDPIDGPFYKALVQVATAQFKLKKGVLCGVRKLYQYAAPALDSLPDVVQGIDVARLREDFRRQVRSLPAKDYIAEGEYPQYRMQVIKIHWAET